MIQSETVLRVGIHPTAILLWSLGLYILCESKHTMWQIDREQGRILWDVTCVGRGQDIPLCSRSHHWKWCHHMEMSQ